MTFKYCLILIALIYSKQSFVFILKNTSTNVLYSSNFLYDSIKLKSSETPNCSIEIIIEFQIEPKK